MTQPSIGSFGYKVLCILPANWDAHTSLLHHLLWCGNGLGEDGAGVGAVKCMHSHWRKGWWHHKSAVEHSFPGQGVVEVQGVMALCRALSVPTPCPTPCPAHCLVCVGTLPLAVLMLWSPSGTVTSWSASGLSADWSGSHDSHMIVT